MSGSRLVRAFEWVRDASRPLAVGAVAGWLSGFLFAGVLGRVAMHVSGRIATRALAMTESTAVPGQLTMPGTGFLLFLGASLGTSGGLFYMAARRWLPEGRWPRAAGYGLVTFATLANVIIEGDNSDYWLLGRWWAHALMFSVLAFGYGLTLSLLGEVLDRRLPRPRAGPLGAVGVALFLLCGLASIGPVMAGMETRTIVYGSALALGAYTALPALWPAWRERLLRSPAGRAVGRGLLLLTCAAGLWVLGQSLAAIIREEAAVAADELRLRTETREQ